MSVVTDPATKESIDHNRGVDEQKMTDGVSDDEGV